MPTQKLHVILREFDDRMRESKRLANDAHQWSVKTGNADRPYISLARRDSIVELAFLRAFLAWEVFLEKSFLAYLCRGTPPRGRVPTRYYFPPNPKMAMDWLTEGKEYTTWTNPKKVAERAERHFSKGYPFSAVLHANRNALQEANTIRNMIAHESVSARTKFENVVRQALGTLPLRSTAGDFLSMTKPKMTPPTSFFDLYSSKFEWCAEHIVQR